MTALALHSCAAVPSSAFPARRRTEAGVAPGPCLQPAPALAMSGTTRSPVRGGPAAGVPRLRATGPLPRSADNGPWAVGVSPSRAFLGRPTSGRKAVAVSAALVTEPATGIVFPPTFTPGATELTLLGTGVREKTFAILTVKVYAVALYVAPQIAADLAPWKGKTLDENFLKALAEAPHDKALVVALAMDVKSPQFARALQEELEPRLEALGSGQDALEKLIHGFQGRRLSKNVAVCLSRVQPTTLQVSFSDDITAGLSSLTPSDTIDSAPLVAALFDVYLGPKTVSPTLLSSVKEESPAFLG